MHRDRCVASLILLLLVQGVPAVGQPRFTRLGKPGFASGISADGRIVVGTYGNFGPAFRWTAEEGMVEIGGNGPLARISRDGSTIVTNAKAFRLVSSGHKTELSWGS